MKWTIVTSKVIAKEVQQMRTAEVKTKKKKKARKRNGDEAWGDRLNFSESANNSQKVKDRTVYFRKQTLSGF